MKTPLEKTNTRKKTPNPLKWLKHKTWFLFDLPFFIKENGFNTGLELGAKAGRSMFYMLKFNKELFLIGIDKWDVIEGSAYKRNPLNEVRCRRRLKKFGNRVKIIQNDALKVAKSIDDQSLDFVHYDLQCKAMMGKHEEMIKLWTTKIRGGGLLIGRDFRDFRDVFYRLGYKERHILRCKIGNRYSERLEYLIIENF